MTEPATADHAAGRDRRPASRGPDRARRAGVPPRRRRARGPRRRRRRLGADRLGRPRERDRRRLGRRAGRRDERVRRQAHDDEPVHGRARDRHRPPERRDGRARGAAGTVEAATATGELAPAAGPVVDRVAAAGAAAPIEEARIIVAGGRGVGGPDGFSVVEELAEALGGAVGATRAAVDCGLDPVRPADRPDRQDREARALPRPRDLRRDPAQGRDADGRARSSP